MKIHMTKIKIFPIKEKFVALTSGHLLSHAEDLIRVLSEYQGNTVVQALDADSILGIPHLLHSIYTALSNWEKGKRFTRKFELEILCYAAADHQISEAIKKAGISKKTKRVVLFSLAENSESASASLREMIKKIRLRVDMKVLGTTPRKIARLRKIFAISTEELKAAKIEDLIMERIASLSLL